jgi:hypothetical protein
MNHRIPWRIPQGGAVLSACPQRLQAKRALFSGKSRRFELKTLSKPLEKGGPERRFPSAKRAISRLYSDFSFRPLCRPSSSIAQAHAAEARLAFRPRRGMTAAMLATKKS